MSLQVLHAFRSMTPRPADEWFFVNPAMRPWIEAQIMHFPSFALPDAESPVCIVGIVPTGSVAEVWMMTGAGFETQVKTVLRQGRSLCASMYQALGLHRMEMRCDQGRPETGRFVRSLGFEYETNLKRAGARGENLDVYVWPDERGSP